MSCHGCAQQFGFLKREIGCPRCGFSYCKKCLRFKGSDEKGNSILVCHRCSSLLSSQFDPEEPPVITKALLRLESLENPAKPPITVYKQHTREARLAQLKKGLSAEDQQLAERLESLRKHDSENVGRRLSSEQIEQEIKNRLARLKDEIPSAEVSTKPTQFSSDKPETEYDLIAKFSEEVKLDRQYEEGLESRIMDMESRLAKLRGDTSGTSSTFCATTSESEKYLDMEELSESEQVAKILERFKAEVEMESKIPATENESYHATDESDANMHSDDDNVDTLCRICEEKKATVKCEECDGDIFCLKCFKELHDELGEIHNPTNVKH